MATGASARLMRIEARILIWLDLVIIQETLWLMCKVRD